MAFFKCYKDKFEDHDIEINLGTVTPQVMLEVNDSNGLEAPVTFDEIKAAVLDCGSQKAPGMSSSFITLILKVPNPIHIKDYRPISLIGLQYKIIAKILANQLAKFVDNVVSPEQSAFILWWQILDGPIMLSEIMTCWKFLDHMLSDLGFGTKWRSLIQSCLHSSRSSVLVNGSLASEFSLKRGLRQGDPLSPFLFLIVMEGLYSALQDAVDLGLIRGTKVGDLSLNISHFFYADDVVITTEWNSQVMENIVCVLHVFYFSSGLKLNIAKSNMYGVGVSSGEIEDMDLATGCAPGMVPFTYLGLPLGSNINLLSNWQPLIDRFHKRLSSWKANLLSIGGRSTLIKAVLGSLGIYYLSIFKCPESVLKSLESLRASFFWGGSGDQKKMAWIKWDNILASYEKGGLNIGSLKAFNLAFLQKWRWHLVTEPDSLWVRVLLELMLSRRSKKNTKCVNAVNEELTAAKHKVVKGFSGFETHLFDGMIAEGQPAEEELGAEQVQVDVIVAAAVVEDVAEDVVHMDTTSPPPHGISSPPQEPSSPPHQPPCPPQPQDAKGSSLLFQQVLDTCSALAHRVEGLENDKAAQQLEIVKLKARAELYNFDQDYSSKVLSMQEDDTEIEMDAEYARKLQEEINKEHEEAYKSIDWNAALDHNTKGYKMDLFKGMTYDEILPIFQAKFEANMRFLFKSREEMEAEDQEIIKSINETLAQKAAKRRKLSKEAQEAKDLRKRLEIVQDEDDDVFVEATPLTQKVPVIDYQIVVIDNKPKYKIIRADDTHQLYISFITLLKNFDREDLETLWRIKLLTSCGVHVNTLSTVYLFLLVERRYPLLRFTLEQLVNVARLQVEEESKMSLELLRFTRQQLQEYQQG
nr:putative RNA-directed DNA polymerase, eukaryota, reverse transcriptase zinc-binding domain protein [Tanacetum cinerariifolium]